MADPGSDTWPLSEEERELVNGDLREAERQARFASTALIEPTGAVVKYIEWAFALKPEGKEDKKEPANIKQKLARIKSLYDAFILKHKTLTILHGDAEGSGGKRAYTLSTVHDAIYLRTAYFDDPEKESRASTLIHEFGHLFLGANRKAERHNKYQHPGYDWAPSSTPGPRHEPITYADAVENPSSYEAFARWVLTIVPSEAAKKAAGQK